MLLQLLGIYLTELKVWLGSERTGVGLISASHCLIEATAGPQKHTPTARQEDEIKRLLFQRIKVLNRHTYSHKGDYGEFWGIILKMTL